jgi:hypothetical protein
MSHVFDQLKTNRVIRIYIRLVFSYFSAATRLRVQISLFGSTEKHEKPLKNNSDPMKALIVDYINFG